MKQGANRSRRLDGWRYSPAVAEASPAPAPLRTKRIVAKMDELVALVDRLQQQLADSPTLGQQLIENVVPQLTATHG